MIKMIIDLAQLYIIVRIIFGAVRLFKGKNKGMIGKIFTLAKRGCNRRLDKAIDRQSALMGYKVIPFRKTRRIAK